MFTFRFIFFCAALAAVLPGHAETTYRWVNAAGETVFSDLPPPPGTSYQKIEGGGYEGEQTLPYAIRVVAEKYPVILYTAANCKEICAEARALLNGRGVPFSEKLLSTSEEIDEISRQRGKRLAIPTLSVGSQDFPGFEAASWNNLLDLAGYPASAPYGSKPSGAFSR
ncbi:MAG: glutaredoxin family protein [Azoarcus sp.]|jgi:hypothetical protein|nr:glutaredoxin family protein [Azoarcus sp.]